MSRFKILTEFTRTLVDIDGNKIFRFPAETLLDNIIPDLWIDIMRYSHRFILWNRLIPCPGYRKVTEEEFPTLRNNFIEFYEKNKGIPNFKNTEYTQKMYFIIDGFYTVSTLGGYITLKYSDNKPTIVFDDSALNRFEWNTMNISSMPILLTSTNIHMVLMTPE